MAKLYNLARMTTATVGAGTITLGSAVSGYLTFALAGVPNGEVVSYGIKDGSNSEVGTGTYTSAGTTLTRTVTKSTNSNAAISLSGSAEVFITPRAEDFAAPTQPQGRLTLTSGTAVQTSDAAAATTVYYTPAVGRYAPLWDGVSSFVMTDLGGELSQATTDTTKSPAAVANNSNYDMFVWNDSGTMRCTRGPAWSSSPARGTGAGTTELELLNGVYVNKVAITNGPAARMGTYVGTIRSNGSAQIDWKLGSSAAGGGMATLGVWNAYNRVLVRAYVQDSTASWTYSPATIRSANGSNSNRVNIIAGLAEDSAQVSYSSQIGIATVNGAFANFGWALDATNSFSHSNFGQNPTASSFNFGGGASGSISPQIGFHFVQATENADGTNTSTFFGNATALGLEVQLRM